ncbi:hypothetical protein PRO82_001176 [Candidatus Protochlamydia amoebophila]|nr:hypothetical protein [Candidatus Protochlamydia amoebophila]
MGNVYFERMGMLNFYRLLWRNYLLWKSYCGKSKCDFFCCDDCGLFSFNQYWIV